MAELGSILRAHIVAIAVAAALVFGWLFSGEVLWAMLLFFLAGTQVWLRLGLPENIYLR